MSPRHPATLLIETLEPRILYSADLMPVATPGGAALSGEQQLLDQTQPTSAQTELLFVDARISNYQTLVDDFIAQAGAGRQIEVTVIGADEDGVAKIGETLSGRQDISAIHLLSHGESGAISLGNSRLDSDTLLVRAPEIAAWGSALQADGDILVYGCEVAEGSAGKLFIDQLAALTGADVAGSENLTGSSAQGGDWALEYQVGTLEFTVDQNIWAAPEWQGVLATYTVTTTADSGAGSLREAILNSNATTTVDDTILFSIAGTGTHTITLLSALPTITDKVIIDATTDDSFAPNGNAPAIAINENETSPTATLEVASTAGGSTIRGLAIWNFSGAAIYLNEGADGNTIAGNYIGMVGFDGNYRANAGNNSGAVRVESANNVIGGNVAADRNVIANQVPDSVIIYSPGLTATGNQVIGNYINVNASGSASIPSIYSAITDSNGGNTIANNWIASAGTGIQLTASANGDTVTGNRIGTDLTGTANWGMLGSGISISGGDNHRIGGTGVGEGNIIAYSNQNNSSADGVQIASAASTGNAILGNLIYGTRLGTTGRGIDLGTSGTTANDVGDGDAGANNLQNFPVLTTAVSNGVNTVTVSGSLNSTANSYYRIEFFASPIAHASGYGEGQIYLGFTNVATDGSGNATFSAPLSATVSAGYAISATATKSNITYTTFTDTSEFAQSIAASVAAPGVLVVDTVSDTNDGDTSSITNLLANKGADGFISLREAIIAANNTANVGGVADKINFGISGVNTHTITLTGGFLPNITDAVIIDATTDDSFSQNGNKPAIVIDGNNLAANGFYLSPNADGSTIRGLVVQNFQWAGFYIDAGSDGNTIAGNYIGRLTTNGAEALTGNGGSGIYVRGANNIIGGTTIADRNIISGNQDGILIDEATATGNQVLGNFIGTDSAGTTAIGNQFDGVRLQNGASNNTIGGSTASASNVISDSGREGIKIDGETSDGNIVKGNWIGIGADGATVLGTAGDGIFISGGADNSVIGGAGVNDGNWIASPAILGIEIDGLSSGTLIQGNRLGTDLAGTANWGSLMEGIFIEGGAFNNLIADNIVAFSGQGNTYTSGISLYGTAGTGNALLRNTVYSSVGIGIDLGDNGITLNDAGDGDTGANSLQNFPVLTLAKTDGSSQVSISGTLNSTASSYFRIEFFASPTADASAYGEGQIYLGFVNVATNVSGNASFSTTLAAAVPVGYSISATATKSDATYSTFTDTSEFARDIVAVSSTQATIIVDTAADTLDGDTTSLSTLLANKGADGNVSLREAITAANNTANGSAADLINFGIAGNGVHTITLASALPTITNAVIINATTDGSYGFNGNAPAIVLDSIGQSNTDVLRLSATADGSTIRGLAIWTYGNTGVQIDAGSDGNTIAGNYIGMVGTDGNYKAGTWNGSYAVYVGGANNVVGGNTAADRNVIGNGSYNIFLGSVSGSGNQIIGNYIGVNASGTATLTGSSTGITNFDGAGGNTIANNVIASTSYGIYLYNTTGDTVTGNRIGVRPDSTGTLGVATYGMLLENADNHVVTNNWIGNASRGIHAITGSDGNSFQGNRIGTDLAGTANWGASLEGFYINGSNNLIGGTGVGQGNIVAYSNKAGSFSDGITINGGTGNAILGNSIYGTLLGSSGLGIDLGTSGVTVNDAGDADAGANNLQNFPVLTLARTDGSSQIIIDGTLNSTASSYYRIEFYATPTADASGYGEGQIYLGFVNVATDGSGNATFSTTLAASVPAGYSISATATKSNATYSTFTDTSEFARSIVAISSNQGVLIVDTASDTSDGDTTSLSTLLANKGADGFISLREAIAAANNTANGSLADLINFGIAGTGVHTITLGSALPSITDAVILDATTDNSFAANGNKPAVVLNGNGVGPSNMLNLGGSGGSTVRGLVITNYTTGTGIYIAPNSNGNTIVGNYIGSLDTNGNLTGVSSGYGLEIRGSNNVIGGSTAADRNVVAVKRASAFNLIINGINGAGTGSGNIVKGNYFGTDATGTTVLTASLTASVSIQQTGGANGGANNTIGGAGAGEGNVIATTGSHAVMVSSYGTGNVVQGNRIGVSATGTRLSVGTNAYYHWGGAGNTGGSLLDNWISGSTGATGTVYLTSTTGMVVQGNRIGTDLAGTANWGSSYSGINLASISNNLIGGTGAGQGNIVAFSNQIGSSYDGLYVNSGTGNAILGNSIYGTVAGTSGLGLDLGTTGMTANDAGDADTGANNLQNFPVLTSATTNTSNTLNITGSLNSSANSYYRIEFFASPTASSSGYGEGATYLGFVNIATDGAGNATFSTTLSANVPAGYLISATATKSDATFSTFTDTSEFGRSIVAISSTQGLLVVDTVSDTSDGDTTSISTLLANKGADDFISLREAIIAANNTANGSAADLISFGIGGSGFHDIHLTSLLPTITEAVIIDASTDDSFAANGSKPAIVLDGNNLNGHGLQLTGTADGSAIRGLVINNFRMDGIRIDIGSDGNTIAGNYIGKLTWSGSVGTNGNGLAGISIYGSNNMIGGASTLDRNVISGNTEQGVHISGGSGNQILGNYIGTDATGKIANGNLQNGINMLNGATGNSVINNVIAANAADGVTINGETSDGNIVRGNRIGLGADGTTVLGMGSDGIYIGGGSDNNLIGGNNPGEGNTVVGVDWAIWINGVSSGNVVRGNYVGTDSSLTVSGGNNNGIVLEAGAFNNMVGGTNANDRNYVTNSSSYGIDLKVAAGTGNVLLGNQIWNNTALGIDIGNIGVQANDLGDADTGANNLQNFPVLTLAKTDGSSQITVAGTLNSTASSNFRIEFFASSTADASGYGEGQIYLGFVNVATDGSGNASFSTTLAASVPAGYAISATATKSDASYTSFTDTSEFAASLTAGGAPVNTVPGAQSVNEDTVLTLSGISVADQGSMSLTVGLSALHGTLNVNLTGGATISAGTNGTAALTLSGSVAQVNAALATLTYQGDADYNGSDTLSVASTDPSTLTANSSVSITVLAVNDAPTISNGTTVVLTGIDENTASTPLLVSSLLTSATWADADGGALKGVAITAAVGNGTWQYSTNGVTWTAFGSVSASNALLLTDSSQIRYIPDGSNGETATFAFKAWDQTTGSGSLNGAPSYANPGAGGSSTAYSSQDASASLTVAAVNDAPIITSNGGGATASITLGENTSAVTTVTATDADLPAQTLTYSISGADAGRFAIDANTGVLTFSTAPDYDSPADSDTNNIYEVTVTVSDGSQSDSQNITVTISPLNDNAPLITSNGGGPTANINVPENNLAVTTVTATDADLPAPTLAYSISGGADASLFFIDSNTGALSFLAAPDFEAPADSGGNNVYDLIVQVSDGSLSGSQTITVTVTNQNENGVGPISDTNGAANSLAENTANGTAVAITAHAVDPDFGDTITYSLDNDAGGRFAINSNTGVVTVANSGSLDYESATSHNIVVRATSLDTSFTTANFTITLTDVNEFAVSAVTDSDTTANSVAENSANGTVVGVTAFASDADGTTNTITYSLDNDAGGLFAINAGTGVVTVANSGSLDYEAATSHNIVIRATSSDTSFTTANFTITLTDVNEFAVSAVTDSDATANSVAENSANGTVVGVTALASDADGTTNTITYSLDNDAGGRFAINASTGVVTVANSGLLDYEAATNHNIVVRATSSDTSFTTANFTISLSDVNEFAISTVSDTNGATDSVAENAANGTAVGVTAFASDADGTTNTITYSLDNDAGGLFAINAGTGVVTVANSGSLDYEAATSHNIVVRATSLDTSFTTANFTITLTDVNEFAVSAVTDIDTAANSVAENAANGTVVGITAFASDADGSNNTVTYSLSNDVGGRFNIDASTGIVRVANSTLLDYETATSHAITVLATSADGSTSSQAFTISLTDVNEFAVSAVSDTDLAPDSVAENAANGTVVGVTALASDADGTTNTISYSLDNDASGRFAINANTGVVTVANSGLLDYEAATSHNIVVRATSLDTSFTTANFTIILSDVNEFAVSAVTDSDATANSVAENAANGTVVGITAFASDADGSNNTVTYSLSNDAGGRFNIDASTGIVRVANSTLLDFEAATSHGITVLATSADGSTSSQGLTISLTDINEFAISAVSDTDAGPNSVAENAANGTAVGVTALASDADGSNNTVTYSLSNDAGGRFTIDASTGIVRVANSTLLDYEAATSHAITVLASSADGSTSSQGFTVNLSPVNDNNPTISSDGGGAAASVNVAENTTAVTTVTASDADLPAQTLSYSIIGGADAALFTINSSTGALSFISAPDFEAPTDSGGNNVYDLIVQVSDGALTDAQSVAVSVFNSNEAPTTSPLALTAIAEDSGPRLITQLELLANAADLDGPSLSAVGLTISAGNGSLVDNGDGTWTYTPAVNDNGSVSFAYIVTDGSLSAAGSAALAITPVNDAPTISTGATVTLPTTDNLTTSSATSVASLLSAGAWADVDSGALKGLAILGSSGLGTWQYSMDGSTWTAFGNVSGGNALLLADTSQIRYVPDGLNGETASFSYRAWDQTAGSASGNGTPRYANPGSGGGSSAYSAQQAGTSVTVTLSGTIPPITPPPPTIPIVPLPPVPPVIPTPPTTGTTQPGTGSTQQTPSTALPAIGDLFFTPVQPTGAGHFELAGITTGQDQQLTSSSVDFYSTRRWNVSYPALQFKLQSIALQSTPGYSISAITQLDIAGTLSADHLRGEASGIPAMLDEGLDKLISPAGVVTATGVVFSAGMLWWAARAGGLMASLALSLPTWRNIDPLSVVGRKKDDPEDWGVDDDKDLERLRDERAVTGMLEDMTEQRL